MSEAILVFIVGIATVVGNIIVSAIASQKSKAVFEVKFDMLERKVEAHNNLIERMYHAEAAIKENRDIADKEFERVNARLKKLEK